MLILFLVVTLLIFLNGLYVASEFSVISLNKTMLENQAEQGEAWAQRYLKVIQNSASQDRFIAVAQLGITLASLGLGMYGEHGLASYLVPLFHHWGGLSDALAHSTATLCALAFLTFWHIVVGEMIPKSLALLYPVATARALWWPMKISSVVLAPLSWILNSIGNAMLVLLGFPVSKDNVLVYSTEELRLVFEESRDEGLLKPERHALLEKIIEFGRHPLSHAMVPRTRVESLKGDWTLEKALEVASSEQYSRYPVVDEDMDSILGVLHIGDIFRKGDPAARVRDVMRPVLFLPETLPMNTALDRMRVERCHLSVVLEESGGTAGIVTLEDLLEEIFGDIRDEYDADERPDLEKVEGGWEAAGDLPLEDLFKALEVELEHSAQTVGGLVLSHLGRPPKVGDQFLWENYQFRVLSLHKKGVERCRINSPATSSPAPPDAPPG